MWNALTKRRSLTSEVAGEVEALREEALRYCLSVMGVCYLIWHLASVIVAPPEDGPRYWGLCLIVAGGWLATFLLQRRSLQLAAFSFILSSIVSITTATWLFSVPLPTLMYPLVALIAVILLHPLAGLITSLGSLAVLYLLWQAGPLSFLSVDRLTEVAIGSLMSVLTAWALGRNTDIAASWALDSYAQAARRTREAEEHRAQLVQALRQLDNAYYRVERANAALELAWKAAETAERSKSEFVANISHELRTPLNLIVGFSEMIVTAPEAYSVPLPAAYRGDLFAIYRSAQHLLTMTDDVLDLARLGAGRMALAREPLDLGRVILDATDIIRQYIEAKGLELRVDLPADLPTLQLDRLRIRQVLLNLLTNAARFTERGGITVSVVAQVEVLAVRVTDTGRGISPDQVARVFDEFYQEGVDRPRQLGAIGGTGLGLPISQRFIELHGGQIGVESSLGAGTTFWFTLPTTSIDGTSDGAATRASRPANAAGYRERVVVLLGADVQLAQFLQRHLRGYRVIPAPSTAEAVGAVLESRAIAVLADLDAVEQAECQSFPVPVLRLPLPHGGRIASELGAVDYLTKPIARQDLQAALARLNRPVRTALVVDDDPGFARLMRLMLRTPGTWFGGPDCEVLTAHTGTEALELMNRTRPDLVLLDLMMPEMGGAEVAATMAASPDLFNVPVIVVSGQDQDRSEWQLALRGPITIEKPEGFCLDELLNAVEGALTILKPPRSYLTEPDRKVE